MTHRGPFQPLPFCDSVIDSSNIELAQVTLTLSRQGMAYKKI